VQQVRRLARDPVAYQRMARAGNPFGDGTACSQIVDVLEQHLLPHAEEFALAA
jgi:UDP-N-acetylglucosamine 2-epimerase (non-hydrolysing)